MKFPQLKPLFLERMQQILPDKKDYESYLEILKHPPVKSIRCNKLKISPSELKKKLEDKTWKIKQPWKNHPEIMVVEGKIAKSSDFDINKIINKKNKTEQLTPQSKKLLSLTNSQLSALTKSGTKSSISSASTRDKLIELEPGELGRSIEHLLGYYYIQELASMLPIIALKPSVYNSDYLKKNNNSFCGQEQKPNEIILDLCAAPGSKTTQIASNIKNKGTIIANDLSPGRIKILASNLERCGVTNTIITRKNGIAFCKRLKKQNIKFNRILIDAPCSGEGTLRSSPKTYLMWNIKTIQNLSKIQKQLVASAFEILKPKGTLIYSTCTHAPEENEEVVDFILKEFKDKIKLEKINLPIKYREGITKWGGERFRGRDKIKNKNNPCEVGRKKYSKEVKKCARIYPHDNNTEGFFIAKFRKLR